jgi:hypothetical protein
MMFHPGFSSTYAVVVEAVHLNVVWTERAVVDDRVWHRVGDSVIKVEDGALFYAVVDAVKDAPIPPFLREFLCGNEVGV